MPKDAGTTMTGGKKGSHLYKNGGGYDLEHKRTEDALTEKAKIRRRMFCAHYIKTTNATASATFAGFKSPRQKGNQLLNEPYVQNLIQKLLNEIEDDAIMTQNEILFQLKNEALDKESANQGARISALAQIAKIRGLMQEKQEVTVQTSGVMLVPVMGSVDEWDSMAAKSQEELKSSVRD